MPFEEKKVGLKCKVSLLKFPSHVSTNTVLQEQAYQRGKTRLKQQ